ncbi:MAG: ABC transporter substrate-binding protein [Microthrixaceae bacterium]
MTAGRVLAAAAVAAAVLAACSSDADDPPVRIGFVRSVPASSGNTPFDEALAAGGFTAGDNLVYVQDEPDTEVLITPEEVTAAVTGWVAEGIDLIVAFSSSGAEAAATAAPDTPVLFLVNDPIAVGLVSDKAHPDRNLTGATFRVPADRTLDLARQAIPGLRRVGVLVPATDPAGGPSREAMLVAAQALDLGTSVEAFADEADIARAVTALSERDIQAIVVVNSPTSVRFMSSIEPVATSLGLPTIANTSLATRAVLVLEPNVDSILARLGRQAARLLGGTPPADVPVEDPTDFRVVLNRTVAHELGLPEFTADLLRQADLVEG